MRMHVPNTAHGSLLMILLASLVLAGCGDKHKMTAPLESAAPTQESVGAADLPEAALLAAREDDRERTMDHGATAIDGPTVITESGAYRVTKDFAATNDAIVIQADNVSLWLDGHRLTGPGNKLGRGIVLDGAHGARVFGGRLERFGIGVVIAGGGGSLVRGLSMQGGDETADPANGNPPQIGVMVVNSAHNGISGNRLSSINLGIFVRGGESYENRIHGNQVEAGLHGLLGICYNPAPNSGTAGPNADLVFLNRLARFGTGIAVSAGSTNNLFLANSIAYFDAAWSDLNGSNHFVRNHTRQIDR